jgi:hypothetical protein
MTVPKTIPTAGLTREQLIVQWREARRKREAAGLGSDAFRAALEEIARIEIEIARIERAMDPPRA